MKNQMMAPALLAIAFGLIINAFVLYSNDRVQYLSTATTLIRVDERSDEVCFYREYPPLKSCHTHNK